MRRFARALARDLAFLRLPGLRWVRDKLYAWALDAHAIHVAAGGKIQALHLNPGVESQIGARLHVGENVIIDLSGGVLMGDRVTVSDGAKIYTHSHPIDGGLQDWRPNPVAFTPLEIGDDVWIGANAVILAGVSTIGAGAIIGAGSVVRAPVPANAVMAGIPAKYIRQRKLR